MDSNFFGLNHIVFAADKPFQHTEAPNPALPGSEIILGTKLTYKVMRKPYILKSDMLFKPVYIYEYINIYIYTSSLFFSFNGTHTHIHHEAISWCPNTNNESSYCYLLRMSWMKRPCFKKKDSLKNLGELKTSHSMSSPARRALKTSPSRCPAKLVLSLATVGASS